MRIKVGGKLSFASLSKEDQDKIKDRISEKYNIPKDLKKEEVLDNLCGKGNWKDEPVDTTTVSVANATDTTTNEEDEEDTLIDTAVEKPKKKKGKKK